MANGRIHQRVDALANLDRSRECGVVGGRSLVDHPRLDEPVAQGGGIRELLVRARIAASAQRADEVERGQRGG
jgi:hypothetical protein